MRLLQAKRVRHDDFSVKNSFKPVFQLLLASLFWVILIPTRAVFAQDDISISYFTGGTYKIRFGFDSAIFSGIGLRSAGMAGVISGINADPASVIFHPAALAAARQSSVIFDFTPGIRFNPAAFTDVDGSVRNQVDGNLADYNVPADQINYPGLDIRAGQAGVLGSGGMIVTTPYGHFGFGVYQPIALSLDISGGGFSAMIETSKAIGNNVTVVQFAAQINPTIQFNINSRATSLSFGRAITQRLAVGATADWVAAGVDLNAFFKLDGIMLIRQQGATSGQEYAFNDPHDQSIRREEGEQNLLDQWAIGSYRGTGWGLKLSSLYILGRGWSLDLALSLPPTLDMSGEMDFVLNKIPALVAENLLSDDPDAEIFNISELNLARPTLTQRIVKPVDTHLRLNLPSSLTLGTSKTLGRRSLLVVNFTQYLGDFSYEYLHYKQGLKFKQAFKLGMAFPMAWWLSPETLLLKLFGVDPRPKFRFGLGVTTADEVKEGYSYLRDSDRALTAQGILLPSFSVGKNISLSGNLESDVLLVALPASFLKVSFLYRL